VYPLLFNDLLNLKSLYLQGNRLTSLDKYLFSGLVNVQEIDFSMNSIKSLDVSLFRGLNRLEMVIMNGNKDLEKVEKEKYFGGLEKFKKFYI